MTTANEILDICEAIDEKKEKPDYDTDGKVWIDDKGHGDMNFSVKDVKKSKGGKASGTVTKVCKNAKAAGYKVGEKISFPYQDLGKDRDEQDFLPRMVLINYVRN